MGVPRLMGLGFYPKLTFDLLDDLSFLVMLSGTLGGLMLWLLGQILCTFIGTVVPGGSAGPTTFTPSVYFSTAIVLHKKFVEERYSRTPWFGRTTRDFSNKTNELQTATFEGLCSFFKIGIEIKEKPTTVMKHN
jgi:hypothetical protein